MTLGEWLITTGTKQLDLARRVGISQGHVSKLARKPHGRRITSALARAIETETGGAVPASIWDEQPSKPTPVRRAVRRSPRRSSKHVPHHG